MFWNGRNKCQSIRPLSACCHVAVCSLLLLIALFWQGMGNLFLHGEEQPTIAYTFLFVEKEEEVPMLPLHHPAHEQTPLCPTLEQKILCVSVCVCLVWRYFTWTHSWGPNSKFDPALTMCGHYWTLKVYQGSAVCVQERVFWRTKIIYSVKISHS